MAEDRDFDLNFLYNLVQIGAVARSIGADAFADSIVNYLNDLNIFQEDEPAEAEDAEEVAPTALAPHDNESWDDYVDRVGCRDAQYFVGQGHSGPSGWHCWSEADQRWGG